MAELEHSDAPLRLAELATVEYFADDHASARRTIEMARDLADRTGNRIALAPLAAIEVALDLWEGWSPAELVARFDHTVDQLAAHPRTAPFVALITAEFGIALVRSGQTPFARDYLRRAEEALGASLFAHTASFRARRLRGLLSRAEGREDEGRAELEALRRDAADEGRRGLVAVIDADLVDRPAGPARSPVTVIVHALAPELSVSLRGERVPPPTGFAAKLLALLIASDGVLTVDAAIEGLWPDADPDIGRNRLHGVLLRLRRGLGLPAGGPITCTEGLVRFGRSADVEIDSWEFERAAAAAVAESSARAGAVERYTDDVLASQFAYDDTVASYRRSLRRQFLRLATSVLDDPPDGADAEDLAALARRAWRLAPEDESLCRAAVRTLARLGHRAEARELIEGTVRALDEVGLDGVEFRNGALADLAAATRLRVVNG
jgi:DNA-binding SARP family transcriptional activator